MKKVYEDIRERISSLDSCANDQLESFIKEMEIFLIYKLLNGGGTYLIVFNDSKNNNFNDYHSITNKRYVSRLRRFIGNNKKPIQI